MSAIAEAMVAVDKQNTGKNLFQNMKELIA